MGILPSHLNFYYLPINEQLLVGNVHMTGVLAYLRLTLMGADMSPKYKYHSACDIVGMKKRL